MMRNVIFELRAHADDIHGEVSHEVALQNLSNVLDGHGVEAVDPEGAPHFTDEGIGFCPPFSHVNMGGVYETTIARDHARGAWVVSCYGDLVEEVEKEHKLGDYEEFSEAPEECVSCGSADLALKQSTHSGRYWWECSKCNHHHQADSDFDPNATERTDDQ